MDIDADGNYFSSFVAVGIEEDERIQNVHEFETNNLQPLVLGTVRF